MNTNIKNAIKGNPINLAELDAKNTTLVVVDMIKGFHDQGVFANPLLDNICDRTVELVKEARTLGFKIVWVLDTHCPDSIEFQAFPTHCIAGSEETTLIAQLEPLTMPEDLVIQKNSTNVGVAPVFQAFLDMKIKQQEPTNFIFVGTCTDICILTGALTTKTYFNEYQLPSRVIVPVDAVETYNLDVTAHDRDTLQDMALYMLQTQGIELMARK